jgi:NADPH-dependent 2,4-dienoyl-CoA reductase/sulfur reductase-like enzyme
LVDAENIFVLRSPSDANQISALSENKNLVIVGTSFIGMEVAAALVGEPTSMCPVEKTGHAV